MKTKRAIPIAMLLSALLLGLAGSAFAVDGITLIKQTPTTVFPIVINTSGSYRLSSDLAFTGTGADAIDINANNVTLDLNGFSIISPGSGGTGINGNAANNVTVTNGVVTGWFVGIQLGQHAHIEGIRAMANLSHGIVAADFSRFIGNVANGNRQDGIVCDSDCIMSGNTANANGSGGFSTFSSVVIGNSASGNGAYGLAFDTNTGYGKNVMENNAAGCVFGGTSMGDNICNGVRQ